MDNERTSKCRADSLRRIRGVGDGPTALQVHKGFTGAIHVTAGKDDQRAFPCNYGVDDLTFALWDRRFDASAQSG